MKTDFDACLTCLFPLYIYTWKTRAAHFRKLNLTEHILPCSLVPQLFVQAAVLVPQLSSSAGQSCPDWLALLLLLKTPKEKHKDNMHWTTFARPTETLIKRVLVLLLFYWQLFADLAIMTSEANRT